MAFVRWRSALLPVLIFAAAVTLAGQQRGGAPAAPAQGAAAPNPNAVGVVNFQPTDGMLTRRLRFEAGARTNWHTHTHRQMIWAEEDEGCIRKWASP
jgi:quercetin dioxygenase-like cupin family protein